MCPSTNRQASTNTERIPIIPAMQCDHCEIMATATQLQFKRNLGIYQIAALMPYMMSTVQQVNDNLGTHGEENHLLMKPKFSEANML